MKYIFSFISFMLCMLVHAQEQESLRVSLTEAQQIAVDNNLTLKNDKLNTAFAEATVKKTFAEGLPQVNGNWSYTNNPALQEAILPGELNFENPGVPFGAAFGPRHSSNLGVSIIQKAFDGVYLLGLKAAKIYSDAVEKQEAVTERSIKFDIAKAYYSALITEQNIKIIDKNIDNINKLLFETKETYKAGFVEQLDVDRLELSKSNLSIQRNNLLRIKKLSYSQLKSLMTIPLSTEIELLDDLSGTEEELLESGLELEEVKPWPEFEVLDVQQKLQEANVERFRKGYLPTVDVFVNGGLLGQGQKLGDVFIDTNNWAEYLNFGLQVGVPIFDGFRKKYQIAEAQIQVDQVKLQREQLIEQIDIAVENARINHINNLANLKTQKDNLELAEKIYNVTKIKYQEGVGSSLELTTAEQELYASQQNYINSLFDALNSKVDLENALGK